MMNFKHNEIRTGLYFDDNVYQFFRSMAGDTIIYVKRDYDNEVYFDIMSDEADSAFVGRETKRIKRWMKSQLEMFDEYSAKGVSSIPLFLNGTNVQIGSIAVPDKDMLRRLHVVFKIVFKESLRGVSAEDIEYVTGRKLDSTKAATVKKLIHLKMLERKALQKAKDKAFKRLDLDYDKSMRELRKTADKHGFIVVQDDSLYNCYKLKPVRKNKRLNAIQQFSYSTMQQELFKLGRAYNEKWHELTDSFRNQYKVLSKRYSTLASSIGCFPNGTIDARGGDVC